MTPVITRPSSLDYGLFHQPSMQKSQKFNWILSRWWFCWHPFEKYVNIYIYICYMFVKLNRFPKDWGENQKILKLVKRFRTRMALQCCSQVLQIISKLQNESYKNANIVAELKDLFLNFLRSSGWQKWRVTEMRGDGTNKIFEGNPHWKWWVQWRLTLDSLDTAPLWFFWGVAVSPLKTTYPGETKKLPWKIPIFPSKCWISSQLC